MDRLLLVYAPFCTPTIMPYSITRIKDFILANEPSLDVDCMDLNAKFHAARFCPFYEKLHKIDDVPDYFALLDSFDKESRPVYRSNNRGIVSASAPELFDDMLALILEKNPTTVGFSLVYSSQAFYALALVRALKQRGITCLIGGPAVNSIIAKEATFLTDEGALLAFLRHRSGIEARPIIDKVALDFSCYEEKDYLAFEKIIPLRTSRSCYYRQCAFCTHHKDEQYQELDLASIPATITRNKARKVFFIDDMIAPKRLVQLSDLIGPDIEWWCQLRPTGDLVPLLPSLRKGGLRSVSWGIESGSQRILDRMRKGTSSDLNKDILKASHDAGIINIVFVMFGFPGETEEEFMQTIQFLKKNSGCIDLVSTSIFGLQEDSFVYNNPEQFGIRQISRTSRTVLDDKVQFEADQGMDTAKAKKMRKRYILTLKKMNRLPKVLNYFKEQTLLAGLS